MQEVAEDNIDDTTQPTDLLTHPNELDPMELSEDGTTLDKNHQNNGSSPSYVIQPSLPKSPLKDASVATDEPPPRPCVEARDATRLSIMEDLPEVLFKGAYDDLYGVYQNWVHQDPGNNLDGGTKEDGKWKYRWKNLSVFQPIAMTHRLFELGKNSSQSLQWSLTAYKLRSGTPSKWSF